MKLLNISGGMGLHQPTMTRKDHWFMASRRFIAYIFLVSLLSAGLVLLQHFCMTHRDGDFVTSYCLTDTHMRAVIAAILTLMGLALTAAVTSAVEAYRTTRLASGILEGVYIAMASQSLRYQLRALLTSWGPVMLIIILAVNAPQSLQTLANLGIRTTAVYVRNRSTVNVFDAYSYYNATVTQTEFANLNTAMSVLTKMRDFRTSATSKLVDEGHGVQTSLLRDAYVGATNIRNSDVTNAFKRLETVVSVTSSCTYTAYDGPLANVVPADAASVNITSVYPALDFAYATVYTLYYQIQADGSMLFNSTFSAPLCQGSDCSALNPDTVVAGSTTNCLSTILVQDQMMVYTVSADSVSPVLLMSNTTTVSTPDLANLIVNYADSIESTPDGQKNPLYAENVFNFYSSYPTGSFNVSQSNVLHTKLCASASLALNFLWTNYGQSISTGLDGNAGNAYLTDDAAIPLYHIVQLTYISTANIAMIAGVITGCAWLVSMVGIAFAVSSRINIKPATDSSLLYNASAAIVAEKQALPSYLSNDPDRQRELEFRPESMLYCRDVCISYPPDTYHRVDVCRLPALAHDLPTKSQQYC